MCNMQDNKHRATYKDLVEFIERQSTAMLDPIFGDLHNLAETKGVLKLKPQKMVIKPSGRTSFATQASALLLRCLKLERMNQNLVTNRKQTTVPLKSLVYFVKGVTHLSIVKCLRLKTKY